MQLSIALDHSINLLPTVLEWPYMRREFAVQLGRFVMHVSFTIVFLFFFISLIVLLGFAQIQQSTYSSLPIRDYFLICGWVTVTCASLYFAICPPRITSKSKWAWAAVLLGYVTLAVGIVFIEYAGGYCVDADGIYDYGGPLNETATFCIPPML
jgi:hypothetical protein